MKEAIVISVGGSLIVPNGGPNTDFLSKLNRFIRSNISKNRRFFLIAGGGKTARHYIDSGRDVVDKLTDEDLDWLGIHATRLNAHLLRTIFRDVAHNRIVENYDRKIYNLKEPIVIGGGWKPGWSTDYDAVIMARDYGASLIINLSNIYWVYDKDPRKFKNAQKIEKTTWKFYETLVGDKWVPGLSAPFDPVAAQLAKELDLTTIITKGDDFRNLQRILDGESFKGSVIMPYEVSAAYYNREYYFGGKGEYKYYISSNFFNNLMRTLAAWYRALYIKTQFNPKTLLDVGCGTGELVSALRRLGVDAKGVEISKEALELANEDVQPFLLKGDVLKLPFKNNSFDMVVTYDVLEHLERSNLKKAAKETIRVAKKSVLHKIYTKENTLLNFTHGDDPSHLSVFSQGFWDRLFNSIQSVSVARKFFKLPSAFETMYLLKKS
jgi:uridylate kinase